MSINKAIVILARYNRWRRGADIPIEDATMGGDSNRCCFKRN